LVMSDSDSPATYVCCSLAVLSVPSTIMVAVMPFAGELGLDELLALADLGAGVCQAIVRNVPGLGGEMTLS